MLLSQPRYSGGLGFSVPRWTSLRCRWRDPCTRGHCGCPSAQLDALAMRHGNDWSPSPTPSDRGVVATTCRSKCTDDARRRTRGHRVCGHVVEDNRVRAHDSAFTDSDAWPNNDVLAQPSAAADVDRRLPRDTLVEYWNADGLEGVHVVGDVDVPCDEDVSADSDRLFGREDAAADDARSVADLECDSFSMRIRAEPAASAKEDAAADGDAMLADDSHRQ